MPQWAVRPVVVMGVVALASGASWWLASGSAPQEAAFWFEHVEHSAPRLGGSLTTADMDAIVSIARAEITGAFRGLGITWTDRRDARYRVRVVQELHDLRFGRRVPVPAEARAVSGFGGQGAVNFAWLASAAVGYAPADADRQSVVEAIGRGVGRAAVHEFAHLFLPNAPIHDSTDVRSYEYASAARAEQYFGEMRWAFAWPLLQRRFRAEGMTR
jgi:hypothetical protein